MSLTRIIYLLGAVALIGQLLLGGLMYFGATIQTSERSNDSARLLAEASAKNTQRALILADKALGDAAQSLAGTDLSRPESVQAAEQRLQSGIPYALIVRILPEGTNVLDEIRTPKMGYADLEMAKQVASTTPEPAVHAAGTPDAHIAIARAVPAKRSVILASLSLNLISESLPPLQSGSSLDIRQGTLSLAFSGDATVKATEATGSLPIPKTPWTIAYWFTGSRMPMAWWMLLLSSLALLLTALGFAVASRWLETMARSDQKTLVKLVEDIIRGGRLDMYPMRLFEFNALAQAIMQFRGMARELPPEPPVKTVDKPISPISPVADATDVKAAIVKVVSAEIFRAYDIRGIVGDSLNADIVLDLGKAIGSEAHIRGEQRVFVARDGRKSSPELSAALIKGLQATGRTVVDLGEVPTPVLYFATHVLNGKSGVMITGSHNPTRYNGLKIVVGGDTLMGDELLKLRRRVETQDFISGVGRVESRDISSDYIDRIIEDMQLGRPMKVVLDAGNGVAGKIAPALMKGMGCDVVELYCDVDSEFPNHHPDPSKPENLAMLIKTVIEEEADMGLAFDGDGDRLGLVDAKGKIIWPDRQMMIFAADVLSRQPGADIIYDVKCSRHLASQIVKHGGRPMMWKTGHSPIKAKMKQTGAMLAGEMSGHIFFKERWFGFDDGLYAAARMVEVLSGDPRTTDEIFGELPDSVNTPELNVAMAEGANADFVEKLKALAQFPEARIIDIDGLRIDFADGWGLVRASNTTPSLVIRFEADDEKSLSRIQDIFRTLMLEVDPTLSLPF